MARGKTFNPAGQYEQYVDERRPEDANALPADRILVLLAGAPDLTVDGIARQLELSPMIVRDALVVMRRLGLISVRARGGREQVDVTDEGRRALAG